MNWYRAKTILIFLFLFADLFLLVNIIGSTRKQTSIAPEIITSTVHVLKNHGIEINTDLISQKIISPTYAEADNVITDYDEFAKLFLGDSVSKNDVLIYESAAGTMKFDGDSFNYTGKLESGTAISDEKSAQDFASKFLKEKGFDLSDSVTDIKKNPNGMDVTFTNTVKSLPVFNSVVAISISNDNVISVSGVWFNVTSAKGQDSNVKTVTSALIDFISSASSAPTQITGISLGYIVPESNFYHKASSLVPVWEIKEANGKIHYPNARIVE